MQDIQKVAKFGFGEFCNILNGLRFVHPQGSSVVHQQGSLAPGSGLSGPRGLGCALGCVGLCAVGLWACGHSTESLALDLIAEPAEHKIVEIIGIGE